MITARRLLVLTLTICSLLMTGCWDALPVEKRIFATAIGLDWVPEQPHLTVTVIHPLMEEKRARENRVLTFRAHSFGEALAMLHHSSGQQLSLGVLSVIVIGRQAAEQPLSSFVNDLMAHPDLRLGAYVLVASGTAQELLAVTPPDHQRIAVHLRDVLHRAVRRSDAPATTLYDFVTHVMTPGADAITALLSPIGTLEHRPPPGQGAEGAGGGGQQAEGGGKNALPSPPPEDVQVVGAALWQGDTMVGELTLPMAQHVFVAMGIADAMLMKVLFAPDERFFPGGSVMTLSIEGARADWSLDLAEGRPHYTLRLDVRLSLHNYAGTVDLSKQENSELFEKIIASTFEQNMLEALQRLVSTGSDALSLGQLVRLKYPAEWDSKGWRDQLKTATFDVQTKVEIRNMGLQLLRLEPVDK
ncbi:MAG: Ger(x)C family spore germination protein [Thermaerobacter sp.]|nr:Ger(x)C family spore germination protein [Thermaerobacter sp.]